MSSFLRDMGKVVRPGCKIFVRGDDGRGVPYEVSRLETRGRIVFMQLDGVTDAEGAAGLVGRVVLLPRERFASLPDGEYYWQDLIGMNVVTEEGEILGRISAIIPTGAQDVYVCTGGAREILLPAIGEVVRSVDEVRGEIVVRLLEGL